LLLVLAMSVDPDAGRDGLPAAVESELQRGDQERVPAAAVPVVVPPAPPVAAASPTIEPVRPTAFTHASLDVNEPRIFGALAVSSEIMPSLAVGAGFGARLPLRRQWSLSFSLFAWNPQTIALPNSAFLEDDGVQLAAGQMAASLCRPLVGERLQLGACAGFGAGLRWVWARALRNEDNPTRAFFGPELGLEGAWLFTPVWFLSAGATTQVQLRWDRFTYRDHGNEPQIWFEPGRLVSRLWLSLGASL
jgi:hypothetical protein